MKRWLWAGLVLIVYLLHQDYWFWRTPYPLFLGFIPIGLFYHIVYSLAAAALMWLLVRFAWPAELDRDTDSSLSDQGKRR